MLINLVVFDEAIIVKIADKNIVVLEKASFQGNSNTDEVCSVLSVHMISNFTLSNVSISDNNCTGVKLEASTIRLKSLLILTRNHGVSGGGLTLIGSSKLVLTNTSKLRLIDNRAEYGGGMYINDYSCFFQFEDYSSK
jgi:hypothetical protein